MPLSIFVLKRQRPKISLSVSIFTFILLLLRRIRKHVHHLTIIISRSSSKDCRSKSRDLPSSIDLLLCLLLDSSNLRSIALWPLPMLLLILSKTATSQIKLVSSFTIPNMIRWGNLFYHAHLTIVRSTRRSKRSLYRHRVYYDYSGLYGQLLVHIS